MTGSDMTELASALEAFIRGEGSFESLSDVLERACAAGSGGHDAIASALALARAQGLPRSVYAALQGQLSATPVREHTEPAMRTITLPAASDPTGSAHERAGDDRRRRANHRASGTRRSDPYAGAARLTHPDRPGRPDRPDHFRGSIRGCAGAPRRRARPRSSRPPKADTPTRLEPGYDETVAQSAPPHTNADADGDGAGDFIPGDYAARALSAVIDARRRRHGCGLEGPGSAQGRGEGSKSLRRHQVAARRLSRASGSLHRAATRDHQGNSGSPTRTSPLFTTSTATSTPKRCS